LDLDDFLDIYVELIKYRRGEKQWIFNLTGTKLMEFGIIALQQKENDILMELNNMIKMLIGFIYYGNYLNLDC
jgi:hypothetical protein